MSTFEFETGGPPTRGTTSCCEASPTVSYYAADLAAARDWYTALLEVEPYFVMPGYIEYRIGDYQHELGIIDAAYAPRAPESPAGEIIHWHVDDLRGAFAELLDRGATEFQPPTDRTEGFVTASVIDPFGNILGIMFNPHYVDVLARSRG